MSSEKKKRGFTLVELLVVISLIAMLIALLLVWRDKLSPHLASTKSFACADGNTEIISGSKEEILDALKKRSQVNQKLQPKK